MKKLSVVLVISIFSCFQLEAQLISVIQLDDHSIELEFQLESYEIDQLVVHGEILDIITANSCGYYNTKGEPALPYFAKSIIIPDLIQPKIEITNISYEEIKVNRILPSKGPLPVGENADDIPFVFGDVYKQDKYFPESNIDLGEPYTLRDYNGVALYFNPFQYNPVKQILRVVSSITIEVSTSDNIVFNQKHHPLEFQNIYENHFVNYSYYAEKYLAITDVGDMIIITTSEFMSAVEPLATWKNRKGIPTTTYLYPDETGTTEVEIKNFIQQIYDQTGTLTFILLVGDADDVPPATGYAGWSGYPADPVYTLLAGDDEYPDAFIGRFSVETPEEAEIVVNKNLWYEMNPDPIGDWYHKATGIACAEVFPPAPPDSVIIEGIRQTLLEYGYSHVDQFYDPGATYTELIASIEEGRGIINYAGHGHSGGWTTTGMYSYLVTQLTNSFKTPVIISLACSVSSFVDGSCFGEYWQRQGTIEEPQGAIAFIGCSITQYGVAGFAHLEMVNLLVSEEYFSIGGIFTNGVMTAIDYDPGMGIGGGPQCFQSWLLFGDPSLTMFTNTPTEMTIDYSGSISYEDTSMMVSVYDNAIPLPNALVALYMNDSLYGSTYTDENGLAEIIFEEAIQQPGVMELTVTSRNKIPIFETVQVLTDITKYEFPYNFSIYPNPSSGSTILSLTFYKQGIANLEIIDITGEQIKSLRIEMKSLGTYEMEIDLSDIPAGVYFCVLKTDPVSRIPNLLDGTVQTKKLIKLTDQ